MPTDDPRDQRIAALEAAVAKAEGERDLLKRDCHHIACESPEKSCNCEDLWQEQGRRKSHLIEGYKAKITTLEAQLAEARREALEAKNIVVARDETISDLRTQLTARDVAGAALWELIAALEGACDGCKGHAAIERLVPALDADPKRLPRLVGAPHPAEVDARCEKHYALIAGALATAPAAWRK
jgi:chromosome segregation ATPase